MSSLITATTLATLLRDPEPPLIFDASWHMPGDRDARKEFNEKHIAGAHFFDLDAFCEPNHPLPNMLSKNPEHFATQLNLLGIHPKQKIVFYDNSVFHTACRAYWILTIAGHHPNLLFILNGGLQAWEKLSGAFSSDIAPRTPSHYPVNYQSQLLCDLSEMKKIVQTRSAQVIDQRHPVRFIGGPEPRLNLRFGHIPNSISFPYLSFTDHQGYFFSLDKIRKNLFNVGVNLNEPIVSTCGSGMSAPILNFFLSMSRHPNHKLYDGSWSEWGASQCYQDEKDLNERPVETYLE